MKTPKHREDFTVDSIDELKRIAQLPVKYHNITVNNISEMQNAIDLIHNINPNYVIKTNSDNISATVDFSAPYRAHQFNTTDVIVREFSESKFYVNIGANDGVSYSDCCYPLYLNGFNGVAFDKSLCKEYRSNIENTPLVEEFLTPDNTSDIFKELNIPKQFALLKIDIDGYDGELLDHILSLGYKPDFIDIEINPEFPPPVKFCARSSSEKYGAKVNGGLYGCSSSFAYEVGLKYGYKLAQLSFGEYTCIQDMVLVRNDIDIQEQQLNEAYHKNKVAPLHLSTSNINSLRWYNFKGDKLLDEIKKDLSTIKLNHKLEYDLYI